VPAGDDLDTHRAEPVVWRVCPQTVRKMSANDQRSSTDVNSVFAGQTPYVTHSQRSSTERGYKETKKA